MSDPSPLINVEPGHARRQRPRKRSRRTRIILFCHPHGRWTLAGRKLRLSELEWPATMKLGEWLFGGIGTKDFSQAFSDLEVLKVTPSELHLQVRSPDGQVEHLHFHSQ